MRITSVSTIGSVNSYSKLDLTLNFIDVEDLEDSMDTLAWCENMYELYLTGNPCTHWEGYKDYVIAKVP